MRVYTIGYGGRRPQEFLDLLQQHGIDNIVDVRLRPDRASMGTYSKANSVDKGIQRLLSERNIAYVSLLELGNVFLGCDDWRKRYQQLLQQSGDLLTERLRKIPTPFALLCAEQQATACHRQLIADHLAQHGYQITHVM